MDRQKQAAIEFRTAARSLQKWVRTNFNILTSDVDSQRELQRLIREVDARATILEFRFPDVDLTGLSQSPVRYWGWCRVPYSLAKTGSGGQLVDCYSLECSAAWNRTIDGLVAAADLIAGLSDDASNEWVHRRETLNETVEDQMMVLFKKDQRTAAMFSPEIAQILDCSEQAVRKSDNKVWQMFKAEKEAAKKKLRRRDTYDNLDDIE
jgi:hypothetical protein